MKFDHLLNFLVSLLVVYMTAAVETVQADDRTLRFGTGGEGGVYHQLGVGIANELAAMEGSTISIEVVPSGGSVDNLAKMQEGLVDIAIVQNDIAYYVYEGVRGYASFTQFGAGVPLFAEYVQLLVRDDSEIRTLGDLTGKTVALGSEGSGSYHNALDLITEAGLRPGIDFEAAYVNVGRALPMLRSGELDVIVTTGALFPANTDDDQLEIRALSLSQAIVSALSLKSPYYVPDVVEIGNGVAQRSISTVSVTAMLVFSDRVSVSQAHEVSRLIDVAGSSFHSIVEDRLSFIDISQANMRRPVPLHPGIRSYLLESGYMESSTTLYWMALIGVLVVVLVIYAQIRCNAYDRLGNVRSATGAWQYRVMLAFSRFNTLIIVIIGFVFALFLLVEAIQYFETEYARKNNIRNEFADINFWQAVLWMFMFMGAGHTENIFPLSGPGRILATALPFLGVGGILGFCLIGLDESRARIAQKKRGRIRSKAKNHVLVCGWNDKAIGIVYSLTSDDVPRKKPVVVVAEIDGDMPLENHDFDPRYVSYQRGDSADHSVLARANIQHADAAVVVAGIKKRAGRNVRSVLSVMALKEAFENETRQSGDKRKSLFVAAELIHDENRPLFHACGADAVITAELVANRMAAQCCVNRSIVEFVLDALTYDDASEMYSTTVSRIGKPSGGIHYWRMRLGRLFGRTAAQSPLVGRALGEVRATLGGRGVNVVALAQSRTYDEILIGDVFDNGHYKFPKDAADRSVVLSDEHVLLFLADRHRDIHEAAIYADEWIDWESPTDEVDKVDFGSTRRSILLVGDWGRCSSVARMLESVPWCCTSILTESIPERATEMANCVVGDFSSADTWRDAGIAEVDQITILAQTGEKANTGQGFSAYGEIDAQAIVTARLARSVAASAGRDARKEELVIAAEMLGQRNRQLFKDADIDVIIPTSLIVERMLTKLVYSKGSVCRFLMAILAFDDNRHIMTLTLSERLHPQLLRCSFVELMQRLPRNIQLLGVLPSSDGLRAKLRNDIGDFEHHFITAPRSGERLGFLSEAGDELLVIVDRRDRLEQDIE